MDTLMAMRTFVEIVERGSLTAAAQAQARSLPTVVRTLASLERRLGARLLRRTTRRMSLTAEGRDYLERCRRILADIEEAELAVARGQHEPQGEIRVTAPALFGQMHVAPLVTAFLRQHQKVQVDLVLLDRVVNLVDEGVDLALRIGPLRDSSMVAIPAGRMRRVVCVSPELLSELGMPAHPDALAEHPCVRFRNLAGGAWHFQARGREIAVPVRGAFSCTDAMAVARACAEGLGFALLLHYQVASLVAEGRLAIVLEEFEPEPAPVSLVYPESRLVSVRLRALVAWLRDELSDRLADLTAT